jgi:SAM-dependent methyltransferase
LCLPNYDLTGASVLDLGCGAGRDVYIASQLVGATGKVIGIDMTAEQLEAARETQNYHAEKFGFANTQFVEGYLESLDQLDELEPGTFDLIISNCVLNLCTWIEFFILVSSKGILQLTYSFVFALAGTDKLAVLKACHKLLKPGGEFYFSDVYASRRVSQVLQDDAVLWGECLSGALYWNDFEYMCRDAGFRDPRLVEDAPITIQNKTVQATIDAAGQRGLEFYSATYRLWKLDNLEPECEDYGQAVTYRGTIPRAPSSWTLDKGHVFEQGRIHPVCGNTWNMLAGSPRVSQHFTFTGNFDTHYGIFEGCGGGLPFDVTDSKGGGGGGSSGASCC